MAGSEEIPNLMGVICKIDLISCKKEYLYMNPFKLFEMIKCNIE